jgi:hypothetical protein
MKQHEKQQQQQQQQAPPKSITGTMQDCKTSVQAATGQPSSPRHVSTTMSTTTSNSRLTDRKRRLSPPPPLSARSPETSMERCDHQQPQQQPPLYSPPYFAREASPSTSFSFMSLQGNDVLGSQEKAFSYHVDESLSKNSHVPCRRLTPSPMMYDADSYALVGPAVGSEIDDSSKPSAFCHLRKQQGASSSLQSMLQDCLQTDFPQDYYSSSAKNKIPCCCCCDEDAMDSLLLACCCNDFDDDSLGMPTTVVAVGKGICPFHPLPFTFCSAAASTTTRACAHGGPSSNSSSSRNCDILFQYIQLICEREAFMVRRDVDDNDDGALIAAVPTYVDGVSHKKKDDDIVTMKLQLHCTRQPTCFYHLVVTWVVHETHWEISCERDGTFVHSCDRLVAFSVPPVCDSAAVDGANNSRSQQCFTSQLLCGGSTDSLLELCEDKSLGRAKTSMPLGSGVISQPSPPLLMMNPRNCQSPHSSYFEALVSESLKEMLNGDILFPFAVDSGTKTKATSSTTDDCLASDQPAPAA